MSYRYQREAMRELAADLLNRGWRVFLSEKSTYGFFTDQEGSRIIYIQAEFSHCTASGQYKRGGRMSGTGWRISDNFTADKARTAFLAHPPTWANYDPKVNGGMAALDDYLQECGRASRYHEVFKKRMVPEPTGVYSVPWNRS